MNLVVEANDSSFEEEVLIDDKLVLVEFGASWCGPCKKQLPILESLASELSDTVKVVKVDIDDAPEKSSHYRVMSVPVIMLFKNKQVVFSKVGLTSKDDLKKIIESV